MVIVRCYVTFLRQGLICVLVDVIILEECCMTSANMQWLFNSDDRIMAHWPVVSLTHLSQASHKGTLANRVDPDQMPQNAASDQGLHCLHQVQRFLQNMIIKKKTNQTLLILEMGLSKELR